MEAINIYSELVKNSVSKSGYAPIVIRIDKGSKHIGRDSIKQKVKLIDWDPATRTVKKKDPNAPYINAIIEKRIAKHREFIIKRQLLDLPIDKRIMDLYLNSDFYSFSAYALNYIETHKIYDKRLKTDTPYSEDSKRRYKDEVVRIDKFQPELKFKNINFEFLEKYKSWLTNGYEKKDGCNLEKNSIWKALSFVRTVYKDAAKNGVIPAENNPFDRFKVGSCEINEEKIKWLEIDQVDAIEKALLSGKIMDPLTTGIGWRFLAMCVSGLRISDAMKLHEYQFNDAGNLEFKPHKTLRYDNTAIIPITTERQRRYFTKALQYHLPGTDAKNFRTTFNIHLKILAAHAGIQINLTSHVGRHTMGGLLVDIDMSAKPAMKILGIKSKKTLDIYFHLKAKKFNSEAEKLKNVM